MNQCLKIKRFGIQTENYFYEQEIQILIFFIES